MRNVGLISDHLVQTSDEGPMLETLDYTIRIGSTPTFLYFDLYLYSAYAAHYVYLTKDKLTKDIKQNKLPSIYYWSTPTDGQTYI